MKLRMMFTALGLCALMMSLQAATTQPTTQPTTRPVEVTIEVRDPSAKVEAIGGLRLNMRWDGSKRFVYPSIWEATKHPKASQFIEYRMQNIPNKKIMNARIEVVDKNNQVVWRQEVLENALNTTNKWVGTEFRTRTNVAGSTDGDGKLNQCPGQKVDGLTTKEAYKFIDPSPNSSPYSARMIMVVKDLKANEIKTLNTSDANGVLNFEARVRDCFMNHEKESEHEAEGKPYMWALYGCTDTTSVPSADPLSNDKRLYFSHDGMEFKTAYDCITPRGNLTSVGHGGVGIIYMGGRFMGENNGFSGPLFKRGTSCDRLPIYDLSNHTESHNVGVNLIHCFTASTASGNPEYLCVISSFVKSLKGTAGAGGSVSGYPTSVQITREQVYVKATCRYAALTTRTQMADMKTFAEEKAFEIACAKNIVELKGGVYYLFTHDTIKSNTNNTIIYKYTVDDVKAINQCVYKKFNDNGVDLTTFIKDGKVPEVINVEMDFPFAKTKVYVPPTGGAKMTLDVPY